MKNDKKEREFDDIEEELVRKELKTRKIPMPISGRGVFEIKRIKDEKGSERK